MAADVATELAVDHTDTDSIGAADADSGHALLMAMVMPRNEILKAPLTAWMSSSESSRMSPVLLLMVVLPLVARANPVIWEQFCPIAGLAAVIAVTVCRLRQSHSRQA